MSAAATPRARLLVRNTVVNAAGQIVPLLVALPLVPFVLRGLGGERFGVLTLAWTVIGYFGFLDLGLGRAATRFVAGLLGAGKPHEIRRVVWSAVAVQAGLGLAGGLAIALLASVLASDVLRISDPLLVTETRATLVVVAFGLPFVLLSGTFSGVLEAYQRFDLVNLVRVPASVATLALPAAGVVLGWSLPAIVAGIVLARAAALLCLAALAARTADDLRPAAPHGATLRELLGFGGWLTVSLAAVPILTYAERLLVGAFRSLIDLAWYAVPFEIVARTAVIPSAIAATLFPAFSHAQSRGRDVGELFVRPLRLLLLLEWPLLVVFWFFPGEILTLWVGADAAAAGAGALRLLAAAFFLNAFAQIALACVQGLGRPDLKAKLDIVQVPLYIAAAALLIARFGITGAAAAKLIFTLTDTVLLFAFAKRLGAPSLLGAARLRRRVLHLGIAAAVITGLGAAAWTSLPVRATLAFTAVFLLGGALWRWLLDPADRALLRTLIPVRPGGREAVT
ncbi:MAG TPA: oligosaccharide flippase family protein [Longimicrobiales bacterium]